MSPRWIPAIMIFVAACGSDYPSRDWSGSYLTRVVGASSDCYEAPVPPDIPEVVAELEQESDNRATLMLNPIVQLTGAFEGDELAVSAAMVDQLALPDTLARRIGPADSFDSVVYDFRGEFEDWRFHGEYVIRTPDVRALVRGVVPLRCTLRYELVGAKFEPPRLSEQPWMRGFERDTAAPADTAPAPGN
jgi:hypothetical protein